MQASESLKLCGIECRWQARTRIALLATRGLADKTECGDHVVACASNTLKRVRFKFSSGSYGALSFLEMKLVFGCGVPLLLVASVLRNFQVQSTTTGKVG